MANDYNVRLIDLTVGQLQEIIDRSVAESMRRHKPQDNPRRLTYGIKGIAELFGVSERQARNIKASGIIAQAIYQKGRTIITDTELALELYGRRH